MPVYALLVLILFSAFFLANCICFLRQSFQSALLESPLLDELEPVHLCFSSLSSLYRVQYHTTLVLLSSCLFGLRHFPFNRQWLDEAIPVVQLPSPAMASKQTCNICIVALSIFSCLPHLTLLLLLAVECWLRLERLSAFFD